MSLGYARRGRHSNRDPKAKAKSSAYGPIVAFGWGKVESAGARTKTDDSPTTARKPIVAINNPQVLVGGTNLGTGGRGQNIALFTQGNFSPNKPQTECTGVIGSSTTVGNANDTADNNTLTLYAGGLFPYAGCERQIDIANGGTVPFHIATQGATVEICTNAPACTTWAPSSEAPFTRALLGEDRDPNSTNDDRVKCWNVLGADWNLLSNPNKIINEANPYAVPYQGNIGNPIQLHENESILCNLALVLDQNPNAEGKTYRYTVSWRTFQWNETPNATLITTP